MAETNAWTPYPHEEVRVHRLWRKRILIGLLLAGLFMVWALSLGVTTETTEELQIYNEDGEEITIERPEGQPTPSATVTLRPGEVTQMDGELDVGQNAPAGQTGAPSLPDPPEGIPFLGLLLLAGPFIATVLAYRNLADQGDVVQANYGIYTGPMPYELITASHADLVRTGEHVDANPFGKSRRDYLRETIEPRRRFREAGD